MIINWENNPEKSIYYLGGIALRELSAYRFNVVGIDEFYQKINEVEKISYDYYFLTIDWLYLLGKIEITDSGDLRLCS